jgi:hypothetical protein
MATQTEEPAPLTRRASYAGPLLITAALIGVSVVYLHWAGRVWWCACRTPTPFSADVGSMHNSQHLFDPYSFSHLLHGIIFYSALWLIPQTRRLSVGWQLAIANAVELGWELIENSPIVIDRYRSATAALGYSGDSIVNSGGDLISCAAGFLVARWLGWKGSLAIVLIVELTMLYLIKDNLALNVLMLLWPIDAIRAWQTGAPPATQPM